MRTFRQFVEDYVYDPSSPQWGFIAPDGSVVDGNEVFPEKKRHIHNELAKKALGMGGEDAMSSGYIRFAIVHKGESIFSLMDDDPASDLKLIKRYLETSQYPYGKVIVEIWNNADQKLHSGQWANPKIACTALSITIRTGKFDHWRRS